MDEPEFNQPRTQIVTSRHKLDINNNFRKTQAFLSNKKMFSPVSKFEQAQVASSDQQKVMKGFFKRVKKQKSYMNGEVVSAFESGEEEITQFGQQGFVSQPELVKPRTGFQF